MATKKIETGELLALICKAASELYVGDALTPGVQIAHLATKGTWYVALHRYPRRLRKPGDSLLNAAAHDIRMAESSRLVACKAQDEDLDTALNALARQVLPQPPAIEAQQELAEALGIEIY